MLKRHLYDTFHQTPAPSLPVPPTVQKLTLHQLKQAQRIRKQIETLRQELAQLLPPAGK